MHKLIRASAGSGKTFQLSGHFLVQLFAGHRPETILATTFTRKAASEILGRVLMRLADAAESRKGSAALAEFLKPAKVTQKVSLELLVQVTQNLHRMRVCTLDSFFQMVARSLSLELGLPPGWSIIDEHVDYDLRQQAIDAVLSENVSRDAQQLMQMLAKGRSKRSVRDLIHDAVDSFYDLFQLTERDAWHQFPTQRRLTKEERELAVHDLMVCDLTGEKRLEKARADEVARFQAGQWEQFATNGVAAKVQSGDYSYYRRPLPPELVAAYERLLTHSRAELIDQLAQQTRAVWELISRFDREYTRLRSEHGWMRFSDVTRALARAESEADSDKMNFRLDSSIRHLLLDEFQDTSPDQWRILKRLATSIADRQEGSSIFCVGDGKQAIYGWRGGVAAILDAVEDAVPGIQSLSLDTSFRSSQPVIETVNRVFSNLTRHGDLDDYETSCHRWAEVFPQHSTSRDRLPGFVQLRTSPELEGDSASEKRSPWHRWVARQIQEMYNEYPGAEIGVLTRGNSAVAALVHELRLLGVPASEEGGTPPVDSPAVLAVLSLLQLSSHPGCQVSRYHVAGSPIGPVVGLNDWQDERVAIEVAAGIRSRLMDDGYGRTLQWVSDSVRDYCSQRDLLRLQQIVAAGWQFDQSPSLNPVDFVRLLENSRFMKSEPALVRVMTVHQSKGLEFDIVVLPELNGQLFRAPVAASGGPGAATAPTAVSIWRSRDLRSLLPVPLQQAFEQTTARNLTESLCLLYVAMTRAKQCLQMLIPPVASGKTPKTWTGLLLASLTDDRIAAPEKVLYETGDAGWYHRSAMKVSKAPDAAGKQHHRAPAEDSQTGGQSASTDGHSGARPELQRDSRRMVRWSDRVSLAPMTDGRRRGLSRHAPSRHDDSQLLHTGGVMSTSREFDPLSVDPRTRGILIHAWFQAVDWLAAGQRPAAAGLRGLATELRMSETEVNTLLPDFFAMLEQPRTRSVLTAESVLNEFPFAEFRDEIKAGIVRLEVFRERPFVMVQNNCLVQGTIDRLVIASRGSRALAAQILDFKTDRLSGDRDEWIRIKQQYYSAQLAQYSAAVQHCFTVPEERVLTQLLLLEADAVVSSSGAT